MCMQRSQVDIREFETFVRQIRCFFAKRDVCEVMTPCLVDVPSFELGTANFHVGKKWLRTSPEMEMKRLVAEQKRDIYQLGPAFREGDIGEWHQEEFLMIEWYRIGYTYTTLMEEACTLVSEVLGLRNGVYPEGELSCISYRQFFVDALGVDPFSTNVEAFARKAEILGLVNVEGKEVVLDFLFEHACQKLPQGKLTAIFDFPKEQASLAKLSAGLAHRFEIFYGPVELANGYQELTSAFEYSRRLKQVREKYCIQSSEQSSRDRAQRDKGGGRQVDWAVSRFIDVIKRSGMPKCSGVSLGLDRLWWCRVQQGMM